MSKDLISNFEDRSFVVKPKSISVSVCCVRRILIGRSHDRIVDQGKILITFSLGIRLEIV